MTPVRLEPAAPRSRVKHSSTEPLTPQIQPGLNKRQVPMATIIFNVRKIPVGIGGGGDYCEDPWWQNHVERTQTGVDHHFLNNWVTFAEISQLNTPMGKLAKL